MTAAVEKEEPNNNNESIEAQDIEESGGEGYQPLYTNRYDLTADVLNDVQVLKRVAEKSNQTMIDVMLLWDTLKNGTFLTLLELKLELLEHWISSSSSNR